MNGWPDGDARHVFLETARGNLCHLCLKPKGDARHISEEAYSELRNTYAAAAEHTIEDCIAKYRP